MNSDRRDPQEERVILVMPADQKDATYLSTCGAIRFVEGRSTAPVPLRIAQKLVGPGWSIEPYEEYERSQA